MTKMKMHVFGVVNNFELICDTHTHTHTYIYSAKVNKLIKGALNLLTNLGPGAHMGESFHKISCMSNQNFHLHAHA